MSKRLATGHGSRGGRRYRPAQAADAPLGRELLVSQGQLEKSLAKATQMLDLATQWGDMNFIGFAHWQTGFIFTLMGKLQEAQKQFDWVLNWITPEREVELRTVIGFGVAAQALSFSAIGVWLLGYPEQARARCIQAVTGAIERGDPYGQAFALVSDCNVLFLVRIDETALQERSEFSYQLCLQQGFVMWQPYMEVLFGWLAVMQGEDLASIDRIRRRHRRMASEGYGDRHALSDHGVLRARPAPGASAPR